VTGLAKPGHSPASRLASPDSRLPTPVSRLPFDNRDVSSDTVIVLKPAPTRRDPRKAARATLRVVLLVSAVLTIVFVVSFVFSEEGISELDRSRRNIQRLEQEIRQLEAENEVLRKQLRTLDESTFPIEKIAREDLGMVLDRETVYLLDEESDR
jgi:cell division protein FtsB